MQIKYMIVRATLAQNRCVVDCDTYLPMQHNTTQLYRKCLNFHPIFKWNWYTSTVKQHVIHLSAALLKKWMRRERVSFPVTGIILQALNCSMPQTVAFIMKFKVRFKNDSNRCPAVTGVSSIFLILDSCSMIYAENPDNLLFIDKLKAPLSDMTLWLLLKGYIFRWLQLAQM